MKQAWPLLAALAAFPIMGEEKPAAPPLPAYAVLTFKGLDGYEMTGVYYPPPRRPAPAILCFHTLGHRATVWGDFPQRLQALGYAVFAVNLRGHPEDVARHAKQLNWLQMELPEFKAMVKDVEAARACMASQREVDPEHIGVMGEEFGANMVLAGAAAPCYRTAVLLTPRLDARGISGTDAIAAFGDRPCLAVASDDDEQGTTTLEALKGAAKGRFQTMLLPKDASDTDFGALMLSDAAKKGLPERVLSWFQETLPLPQGK